MPAPKGNQFAIGNSGRSKKWKSAKDLQRDIDAYFAECDNNTRKVYSKAAGDVVEVPDPIPYTIEGLADTLDCDRETLLRYEKQEGYEEFYGTIKSAKNKIQRNKLERGLMGHSNSTVTIFDLKNNHGYVDRTEHDMKSTDGSMSPRTLDDWYDEKRGE